MYNFFFLLKSSLYKNPTSLLCSKLLFFLSFYKMFPILWIILHVLLKYESESERVVKDKKHLNPLSNFFPCNYVNTFIWFKWNLKKYIDEIKKSSCPEPRSQFQPNLARSIPGWRGFKFVQMKGHALFQRKIIMK